MWGGVGRVAEGQAHPHAHPGAWVGVGGWVGGGVKFAWRTLERGRPPREMHAHTLAPSPPPNAWRVQSTLTRGLDTPQQLYAEAERIVWEETEALLGVRVCEGRGGARGGGCGACRRLPDPPPPPSPSPTNPQHPLHTHTRTHTRCPLQAGMSEEQALSALRDTVPGILGWKARFLRASPAPGVMLNAGFDPGSHAEVKRAVAVQVGGAGWVGGGCRWVGASARARARHPLALALPSPLVSSFPPIACAHRRWWTLRKASGPPSSGSKG